MYTLAELKQKPPPEGVDPSRLEVYLNADDFQVKVWPFFLLFMPTFRFFLPSFVRDYRSFITFVRSFADSLVRWLRSCYRLFVINVTNDSFDRSINCLFA